MKVGDITPVNRAREFNIDELFFSLTNEKGIITACNDIFIRVSGYESKDLIGKPHNCIRHPDMPRCIFKLLWDYILSGRKVGAYVKNLASTGEYYWVYALVTSIDDGYLSIRIKPSTKYFSIVNELYKDLLEIEKSYGKNWREGMEASSKELLSRLAKLGFSSYDMFLNESLREELVSRAKLIKELKTPSLSTTFGKTDECSISGLFNQVLDLVQSRDTLNAKSCFMTGLAEELELVAMNSTVQASLLGREGSPLAVIGQEITRMANLIKNDVNSFGVSTAKLLSNVDLASLSISIASLQNEMSEDFTKQTKDTSILVEDEMEDLGKDSRALIDILDRCSLETSREATNIVRGLLGQVSEFEKILDSLAKVFQVLQFSYVTGSAEMVRISKEEEFKNLLTSLSTLSSTGSEELKKLSVSIGSLGSSIKKNLSLHMS